MTREPQRPRARFAWVVWCAVGCIAVACATSNEDPAQFLPQLKFDAGDATEDIAAEAADEASGGAAGASGGAAGSSGSMTGGSGGKGGTSSGGGSGGAGGGTGGGTGGSSEAGPCGPTKHMCNGTCVANTPQTGCVKSVTCEPCPPPSAHGAAVCTAGGACAVQCDANYTQQGTECVCTLACCSNAECADAGQICQNGTCVTGSAGGSGGGGTGGTGGSSGKNCNPSTCNAVEDYNCLLDCVSTYLCFACSCSPGNCQCSDC
ncbi:MAG: hypothetical protein HY898_12360 [Deltaproteobacteria bacterium]|nr:hypothetical protein [Deltaproteobacteria bacterium]